MSLTLNQTIVLLLVLSLVSLVVSCFISAKVSAISTTGKIGLVVWLHVSVTLFALFVTTALIQYLFGKTIEKLAPLLHFHPIT